MASPQEALQQGDNQEARNFFGAANQLLDTAAGREPRRQQPVPISAETQILNVRGRLIQVEKSSRRTHARPGNRTIDRCRRWLPSSPLYSSVASDHGQQCSDGRQQRCYALQGEPLGRVVSPGLPPRLTRCVRLPRHLFVRCPFLVRCSSLRSNDGGSPISPLLCIYFYL